MWLTLTFMTCVKLSRGKLYLIIRECCFERLFISQTNKQNISLRIFFEFFFPIFNLISKKARFDQAENLIECHNYMLFVRCVKFSAFEPFKFSRGSLEKKLVRLFLGIFLSVFYSDNIFV